MLCYNVFSDCDTANKRTKFTMNYKETEKTVQHPNKLLPPQWTCFFIIDFSVIFFTVRWIQLPIGWHATKCSCISLKWKTCNNNNNNKMLGTQIDIHSHWSSIGYAFVCLFFFFVFILFFFFRCICSGFRFHLISSESAFIFTFCMVRSNEQTKVC